MNSSSVTIAAAVDADALVELVTEAVRIPSVTPNEMAFAQWVESRLQEGPWQEVSLVEPEPGRPNVYARVGGDEEEPSRSLLLAGHLDTVHAEDWRQEWSGSDRADPYAGHVIEGEIWGRGATDQKGGICSIIEALRAVDRAGFRLGGSVTGLFVCDEESGQPRSGVSLGMRAAVKGLLGSPAPTPGFAIYTEPTTGAIYTAQMGFLIADITLGGKSAYFGTPELGIDALKAGHALLSSLWEYNETLSVGGSHPLLGERFLLATTVVSGGNIAVPGTFELSLIQKFLPGDDLEEGAAVLRQMAAKVGKQFGVTSEVRFPAPRDHAVGGTPDEISADHPAVRELANAVEVTTGRPVRIEGAPYWSEKPLLRSVGIPGVYFAAGDIATCHTPYERLPIEELVSSTRALASFVASWCGAYKSTT